MKTRMILGSLLFSAALLFGGLGCDDSELPSSCGDLIEPLAGTYTVIDDSLHYRGTITIDESGAVDFDEHTSFEGTDIESCFDRLSQEHDRRVQISYGFDDDSSVINIYLPSGSRAEDVEAIEFRHRDLGIELRSEVEYAD